MRLLREARQLRRELPDDFGPDCLLVDETAPIADREILLRSQEVEVVRRINITTLPGTKHVAMERHLDRIDDFFRALIRRD